MKSAWIVMFLVAVLVGVLFGILFNVFVFSQIVHIDKVILGGGSGAANLALLKFLKGLMVFVQWVGSIGVAVLVGVKLGFYFYIDIPAADISTTPPKPPTKGILKKLGGLTTTVLDAGWRLIFKPFYGYTLVDTGTKTALLMVKTIPTTKTVGGEMAVEGLIEQVIVQITYTVNDAEILDFVNIGGHIKVVDYLTGVIDSYVRQAANNIGWVEYYAGKVTLETGLKTRVMGANIVGGNVKLGINVDNVLITHIEALEALVQAFIKITTETLEKKSFNLEQSSFQDGVEKLVEAGMHPDVAGRLVSVLQGKVPGENVSVLSYDVTGLTNIEGPLAALAASFANKLGGGLASPSGSSAKHGNQLSNSPGSRRKNFKPRSDDGENGETDDNSENKTTGVDATGGGGGAGPKEYAGIKFDRSGKDREDFLKQRRALIKGQGQRVKGKETEEDEDEV